MGLAHGSAGSGTSKWPEAVSSSPTLNHRRIGLRSPSHSAISLSLSNSLFSSLCVRERGGEIRKKKKKEERNEEIRKEECSFTEGERGRFFIKI